MRQRRVWRTGWMLAGVMTLLPVGAAAGGFLRVDPVTGEPFRWDATKPIIINLDRGPFGRLTKQQADELVARVTARWSSLEVPTARVAFERGPDLSEDHGDGVSTNPALDLTREPDGVTPIIFDQRGRVLASLLGAGQERLVIGLSGSVVTRDTEILEGRLIMNGLFYDGDPDPPAGQPRSPRDVTLVEMEGLFLHEFGHLLNLDHASFNNNITYQLIGSRFLNTEPYFEGFPTMFPFPFPQMSNLAHDDRVWVSTLYPSSETQGRVALSGQVLLPSGLGLQGVNLVAQSLLNPDQTVSVVSGYRDGTGTTDKGVYTLPGLDPQDGWLVRIEAIPSQFRGLARVGLPDPPLAFANPEEWLNLPGQESSNDDIFLSSTFTGQSLVAAAGEPLNLQLNPPLPPLVIDEVDPADQTDFRRDAMVLPVVPGQKLIVRGTLDPNEGGNVAFYPGDAVEDWYRFNPPAGVEVRRVRLIPNAGDDADLFLASLERNSSGQLVAQLVDFSTRVGRGREELIEPFVHTGDFGKGTIYEGEVFIAISTIVGNAGGSYTLEIETQVSSRSVVVVREAIRQGFDRVLVDAIGLPAEGPTPEVRFSDEAIRVLSVERISPWVLAAVIRTPQAVPDPVVVTVQSRGPGVPYGGQALANLGIDGPIQVVAVEAVLGVTPPTPADDANRDGIVDAADVHTAVSGPNQETVVEE